jgi:hypothetical protein
MYDAGFSLGLIDHAAAANFNLVELPFAEDLILNRFRGFHRFGIRPIGRGQDHRGGKQGGIHGKTPQSVIISITAIRGACQTESWSFLRDGTGQISQSAQAANFRNQALAFPEKSPLREHSPHGAFVQCPRPNRLRDGFATPRAAVRPDLLAPSA